METEVLRWFQEVADGHTVTEVSEVYRVSQPAVSRALGRLEAELGTPLLRKSGRVLRLTHAGVVFKRHVDALIHDLDDGIAAVEQLIDPETGTVTVAFQLSLGMWLVPDVVRSFRARHPGVRFRLEHSDDTLGSAVLTGERVDVELTTRRPTEREVHWRRLFAEPLLLAVPPDHPLAGRPSVWLAAAATEDFVMLPRPWALRARCEELCTAAGFEPRVAFEADDLPTLRGLVGAGLGVAIVPSMGQDPSVTRPGEPCLVEIADPGASRDVGLAWPADRRLLPAAELFRRHVLATHGPHPRTTTPP